MYKCFDFMASHKYFPVLASMYKCFSKYCEKAQLVLSHLRVYKYTIINGCLNVVPSYDIGMLVKPGFSLVCTSTMRGSAPLNIVNIDVR